MGEFSESVKLEVKRKAAFRCCRCQNIGIQVHHIIPEEYGGPDDISNAAPLCPNCHIAFGDNPIKRKEIKQMRDWWYEQVEKMYPAKGEHVTILESLRKIDTAVVQLSTDLHSRDQTITLELKSALKEYVDQAIDNLPITPVSAISMVSGIVNSTTNPTVQCKACGSTFPAFVLDSCPNCGTKIQSRDKFITFIRPPNY